MITDPNGNVVSETLYKALGEVRFSAGSLPTNYTYTGQRSEMEDIGLMFYNACWPRFLRPRAEREGYDPELGRFAQADTTVPGAGNAGAYDRYAYVLNNPIMMNDPSGHCYNYSTPEAAKKCNAYWAAYTEWIKKRTGITEPLDVLNSMISEPIHKKGKNYKNFGQYRDTHKVEGTNWFGLQRWHTSIDVGGLMDEEIYPILSGNVIFAGWDSGGLGNTVVIETVVDDEKYYIVYGHLGFSKEQSGISVSVGDFVTPVNSIGNMGNSLGSIPNGCSGPACPWIHLHFEGRTAANINLSSDNPLYGQRYWAFEGENWKTYFIDLGKIVGYEGADPQFLEDWGLNGEGE